MLWLESPLELATFPTEMFALPAPTAKAAVPIAEFTLPNPWAWVLVPIAVFRLASPPAFEEAPKALLRLPEPLEFASRPTATLLEPAPGLLALAFCPNAALSPPKAFALGPQAVPPPAAFAPAPLLGVRVGSPPVVLPTHTNWATAGGGPSVKAPPKISTEQPTRSAASSRPRSIRMSPQPFLPAPPPARNGCTSQSFP